MRREGDFLEREAQFIERESVSFSVVSIWENTEGITEEKRTEQNRIVRTE